MPNSQDISAFYLDNIYRVLAEPNSSSTVVGAPAFLPPNYAIWVNSLWLSSLAICLTSAFLATLLQQWTRRSIDLTQPPGSPGKRAQIHQFFSGVDDFHIQLAADAVPTLLHLSVLLFLVGLLVLLRNINVTVFNAVIAWVVLSVAIYAYVTFLPISRPASTDYSPLSSLIWQFSADILYFLSKLVCRIRRDSYDMGIRRPTRLLKRLEKKAEEIVLRQSLALDARILESLLDTVGEDDAQEMFFEVMPEFYSSRVQKGGFEEHLSPDFVDKFRLSVDRFLDETLSSDWVSESTRSRRLLTCLNATHKVLGDADTDIADRIIHNENWIEAPPSPEIGRILRRWRKSTDSRLAVTTSCIIAQIIAGVGEHDHTWMALAISQLGVTQEVLRNYLEYGDSVFLANLIHTTRQFFEKRLRFQGILRSISKINVQNTLPGLQHHFCTLWNEIARHVQEIGASDDSVFILREIDHVYDALHPTAPAAVIDLPSYDSMHLGFSLTLCPDPQSHLTPTATHTTVSRPGPAPSTGEPSSKFDIEAQRIAPVASSSSSPLKD